MDQIDRTIVEFLQREGRASWTALAKLLNISSTAVAERVHSLENRGIIIGYKALVNPKKVGCGVEAFIHVEIKESLAHSSFVAKLQDIEPVRECYNITGEGGYLLKVSCKDIEMLDELVSKTLKEIPEVSKTVTSVVLSTLVNKESCPLFNKDSED